MFSELPEMTITNFQGLIMFCYVLAGLFKLSTFVLILIWRINLEDEIEELHIVVCSNVYIQIFYWGFWHKI